MGIRQRPLSPHLQVYRWQITMVMSILHRATGIALSVGSLGLTWWLLAAAAGGESYATAARVLASPIGLVVLGAFSLALVFHLLNGIRHLGWDIGKGLAIPDVYRTGYTVFALTVVLTALIWVVALGGSR